MNNKDFLNEVHSYIDNTYSEFEKYQIIVQDTLKEFAKVCRNNNIQFWLAFGNMIGAVRDHSQLPWDYDIDVLTPVKDRNKLIEALNRDLDEKYSYAYWTNTKHYPTICLRVYNKKYTWMALHVDVFFLIGAPSDKTKQEKLIKEVANFRKLRKIKNLHYQLPNSNKRKQFLIKIFYDLRYLFISDRKLEKKEKSILYKYPMDNASFYMPFGGIRYAVFPKDVFGTEMMEVNGNLYPVPSGHKEFLGKIYGDWQKYLPIKKRFEEFYKMKNIVDERQKFFKENDK